MKRPSIFGLAAALIVLIGFTLTGCREKEMAVHTPSVQPRIVPQLSLDAVGDIMLARHVGRLSELYGTDYPFRKLGNYLAGADLTFGNLESPVASSGSPLPGKGICFRADPVMVRELNECGFDILSVANNHSLDYDAPAFLETLENLKKEGIKAVGGGINLNQARQPLIIDKNGVKVGFLAYTEMADIYYDSKYRRAFKASETECGVAPLQREIILQDLARLEPLVDVTVVSLHWGTEYSDTPTDEQRRLAHELIDRGAELVIGHHPHRIQGLEAYHKGLIAYSLGNFVFDQNRHDYTRQGLILHVTLGKDEIKEAAVAPVYIDNSQPYVLQGTEARGLLEQTAQLCEKLGTPVSIKGNRLYIPIESGSGQACL